MELFPTDDTAFAETNSTPMAQFFTDAQAGTLPSFSLLDPNYDTQSQENPQNIVVGEAFMAQVVQALGSSPLWRSTLLILTYDEHGGYYDHVPPPAALAPDPIPPMVQPGESTYDGFHRYGFRVPAVLVGLYIKRNYVSHVVYDHTSILAFLERKWNLPALTHRDANGNDLTDFLDLGALAAGQPTSPSCRAWPRPATPRPRSPASAPAPAQSRRHPRLRCRRRRSGSRSSVCVNRRLRGLVVELETNRGSLRARRRASTTSSIGWRAHGWRTCRLGRSAFVLREHHKVPPRGWYEVVVRRRDPVVAKRAVRVR